jgi:hypothetical protein
MPKKQNTLATLGETPVGDQAFELPPGYGFVPPQLPPLNFDLQTQNPTGNIPYASGGITLPLLGHELQLQYGYQRDPYAPMHDFRATFRRQF